MAGSEVAIRCSFGVDLYGAGDVVSALIQAGGPVPRGRIHAQAYGHLFIDQKWLKKDYTVYFTKLTSIELSSPVSAPPRQHSVNNLSPHCIYLTPKEEINPKILNKEGVLLQFQLPNDVYPSSHGMSCSVNYSIAISWEQGGSKRAVYFPFRVSGAGSASAKQLIRSSYTNGFTFIRS